MSDTSRDKWNIAVAVFFLYGLLAFALLKPDAEFSLSERRTLAKKPKLSAETVFASGGKENYMSRFETYAVDQFPLREGFRTTHALFSRGVLLKKQLNQIYFKDGHLSKLDGSVHEESVAWSLDRFAFLREKYLENARVYLCIIPDKNHYLLRGSAYPDLDYEEFVGRFREASEDYAEYIDIEPLLGEDAYYRTDLHWKQECLAEAAEKILTSMGHAFEADYGEQTFTESFRGVYYGQAALPVKPDEVRYLTGRTDDLKVFCYDSGKPEDIGTYDMVKGQGADAYELFLSGSRALIVMENPAAKDRGELVVFRDSFGSSIAPLLAQDYAKVTLVDIRYMSPAMVGRFVEFENADVLFLYSTQVLNNSVGQFLN